MNFHFQYELFTYVKCSMVDCHSPSICILKEKKISKSEAFYMHKEWYQTPKVHCIMSNDSQEKDTNHHRS